LTQFGNNSLATIEFTLTWQDQSTSHEESYLARRVNAWRDIFPPGFTKALIGKQEGDEVVVDYEADDIVASYNLSDNLVLSKSQFTPPSAGGRRIPAAVGRYYPQGALRGLPHVYPQNAVPFRLLGGDDKTILADCNHPMAGRPFQLKGTLQTVEDKKGDTGGTLYHWLEEICNFGPGMQASLPDTSIAIDDSFYDRLDSAEDKCFYQEPRLVPHIDAQASKNLKSMYERFIKPGMRILDLMSSHTSHLPHARALEVMGLGMNEKEMEENPLLSHRVVHNLNQQPIPESITQFGPFDIIVCSLSIEYLTDPVAILKQARKLLIPGGTMMIGFSNRWFPTKAIRGWMDLHPFERSGMVLQWLRQAGFEGDSGSMSCRNDWRPRDDRHFMETRGVSDPVFMVWARST